MLLFAIDIINLVLVLVLVLALLGVVVGLVDECGWMLLVQS